VEPPEGSVILFDDFNDGVIDSSKWIHNGWSGSALVESDGTLYFETGTSNDQQIRTKTNIGQYDDFTITFKMKPVWVSGDKNVGFWLGNLAEGNMNDGKHRGYYFQLHGKTKGFNIGVVYDVSGAGLHDKYDPPSWTQDTWHTIKIVRNSGEIKFYVNGELVGTDSTYASQMRDLYWVTGRTWKDSRSGEAAQIYIDDFSVTSSFTAVKGDINGDGNVNLKDAILCLQVISDITPSQNVYQAADVNGDGKIGLSEAIFIMRRVGEL